MKNVEQRFGLQFRYILTHNIGYFSERCETLLPRTAVKQVSRKLRQVKQTFATLI